MEEKYIRDQFDLEQRIGTTTEAILILRILIED